MSRMQYVIGRRTAKLVLSVMLGLAIVSGTVLAQSQGPSPGQPPADSSGGGAGGASGASGASGTEIAAPVLTGSSGQNVANLSWGAVTNATRYQIVLWTESGLWDWIDSQVTGTSYAHSSRPSWTDHYYWVRAFAADGTASEWSNMVYVYVKGNTSGSTPPLTLPTLTLSAGSEAGSITASWTRFERVYALPYNSQKR